MVNTQKIEDDNLRKFYWACNHFLLLFNKLSHFSPKIISVLFFCRQATKLGFKCDAK